jgi:hypothetical protein
MLDLTPERLLDIVKQRYAERQEPLLIFWCHVSSDRESLFLRLKELRGELSLVPLVLRGSGFDNPNAIMTDLRELIIENRSEFESTSLNLSGDSPLALLLLSRRQFDLPQISSPTSLPDWFPTLGGQTVYVFIEDLTRSATGPLDIPEAHIDDIRAKLFVLEGALLERIKKVRSVNHSLCNQLFEVIKNPEGQEKIKELLEAATVSHSEVRNPSGFRPSTKDGRSLISRFLSLVQRRSFDQLTQPSSALAAALGVTDEMSPSTPESLTAVLLRPTQPDSPATRLGRNILISIYMAAQFSTSAAHAGDYPSFPIILIRSLSYDLRVTLERLTMTINQLSD